MWEGCDRHCSGYPFPGLLAVMADNQYQHRDASLGMASGSPGVEGVWGGHHRKLCGTGRALFDSGGCFHCGAAGMTGFAIS